MDQNVRQKIQARFEELPQDVQRAITSADADKKIQEIGVKNALHIDQIGSLSDETYLVMLGFTEPTEFAGTIAKQVKVPQDKAEAIARELSEALFVPIRQSMQEFTEERALRETLAEEAKAPKTVAPVTTTPVSPTPPAPAAPSVPAPVMPAAPLPAKAPDIHPTDMMLTQKTVSVAPPPAPPKAPQDTTPAKPQPYKADPYREPTN